jgi:hypothetical protein
MVSEEDVKRWVVSYLKSINYKIISVSGSKGAPKKAHGLGRKPLAVTQPDIKARKGTDYYFVEAKGDPANITNLYTAIGQIVTKMVAATPTTFAIALSPSYKQYLHLFPPEAQKKFKIKILMPETEKKRLPDIIEIPRPQ